MKTITPTRYRGGLVFAMITTALVMLPRLAISAETMTVTNQLGGFSQTYPPANGPFELYTSVVHSQGETYVVMPDATGIPKVTQISEQANGTATHVTVNLDQPDYRALNDAHNGYSIGIDKDGYLHIAGDMHNFGFSDGRQGVPHPETTYPTANEIYPVRYQFNHPSIPIGQRATILYWVSNKPRDISAGFTFTGTADNPRRIPGTGWSYGRFFNDRNGELFYSSRGSAVGRFIGALGVTLNSYDVATRTWTTRGAIPPASSYANQSVFGDSQTVLFWSEAGEPPTASKPNRGYRNYQVYQAGFNFDLNNRLHFVVSGYVDIYGKALVLHAASDDAGLTWMRSNGEAITGSLLRGDAAPGAPGRMTVVYPEVAPTLVLDEKGDANPINDTWISGDANPTYITKVLTDATGNPIALHGVGYMNWRTWDSALGAWKASSFRGTAGNIDHDGNTTGWSEYGIWRNGSSTNLLSTGIISPSQLEIQKTGKIYGLVKDGNGTMSVRKITFAPAPGTPGLGFVSAKWNNIPGRQLLQLINNSEFPHNPDIITLSPVNGNLSAYYPTTLEGTGTRMRGYFIAPISGTYVFQVWGKFGAQLYVSPDEWPRNRGAARVFFNDNLALSQQSPILPGQWDRASVSSGINLVADKRYYVEVLHKGASTTPFIEVGITRPDGLYEHPIPASRFDPWENHPPEIKTGIQVANLTSTQAQLSVIGEDEYEESTLKYSWSATGPGTVTFSAQNTNAAKASTATFSQAGTYLCRVVVTDDEGLTGTTSLSVTVN